MTRVIEKFISASNGTDGVHPWYQVCELIEDETGVLSIKRGRVRYISDFPNNALAHHVYLVASEELMG